jgi:hypothetical protein
MNTAINKLKQYSDELSSRIAGNETGDNINELGGVKIANKSINDLVDRFVTIQHRLNRLAYMRTIGNDDNSIEESDLLHNELESIASELIELDPNDWILRIKRRQREVEETENDEEFKNWLKNSEKEFDAGFNDELLEAFKMIYE